MIKTAKATKGKRDETDSEKERVVTDREKESFDTDSERDR